MLNVLLGKTRTEDANAGLRSVQWGKEGKAHQMISMAMCDEQGGGKFFTVCTPQQVVPQANDAAARIQDERM